MTAPTTTTPAALDALAAELRSSAELPVCPFDLRAPRHDLKPTDPCPICGGLGVFDVDGGNSEDRCKGADLSVLSRAADALDALKAQVETLTAERDNLVLGLNSIVNCKSTVTRPALREAAAEVLGRRTEGWQQDQSPFATLAHEANARLLASDTARASAEAALAEARASADGAYLERNRLVALLASLFPSGIKDTAIEGWDAAWHGCVYIDLPTGQASWHFHESQQHLFKRLPPYAGEWDGHSTDEKYQRVARAALEPRA